MKKITALLGGWWERETTAFVLRSEVKSVGAPRLRRGFSNKLGAKFRPVATLQYRLQPLMIYRTSLILVLLGFTLSSCANTQQSQITETKLESNKQSTMQAQNELIYEKAALFPENTQLSIAIIARGKVHFVGIKRINDTIIPFENHRSVFEIGSISKVFTATLLATLAVNNKLQLENSLQDCLDFEINPIETITLKELSNHTAGLPRLPSNLNLLLADPNNPYKDYDAEKLSTYLKEKISLNQSPGEKYDYSNLGAGLLGYLLGEISNSTYQRLLEELIFSQYEMSASSTDRKQLESKLVKGLDYNGDETANWDLNILAGAGGILSTAEDLAKFAVAHFDDKHLALQLSCKPTFKESDNLQIGLGWHIIKNHKEGHEFVWHNGGTGGYTSSMALDLKNKHGIVILSNVSAFNKNMGEIDKLCFDLLKTLWDAK